jgi:hypothetical protein
MKKTFYILLFTIITSSAMAQDNFMSWQYSVGFGTGDLHNFVSPVSFRGVTYNYSKFTNDNIAVGMEIGWNVFYEKKGYDTYTFRNFDYSGKQYRYSNNVPFLFTVGYYKDMESIISPFVNLGIGTMYSERKTSMGSFVFTQDGWHFELKPELGFMYNTQGASLSVSAKYYYGFKAGDLPAEGYFTINVGFVIKR